MSLRVLIVDESAASGRLIKLALEGIPDVEVAGLYRDARTALERIRAAPPDVVTLPLELRNRTASDLLLGMRREQIRTAAVIIADRIAAATDLLPRTRELGILGILERPQPAGAEESAKALRDGLGPLLSAAAHRKEVQSILRGAKPSSPRNGAAPARDIKTPASIVPACSPGGTETSGVPQRRSIKSRAKPAMVLIGVSTGGPEALAQIIPALPANLRVPVLIVQHMPPLFTQNLAQKLDSSSVLRVKEAEDGELALQGYVYIAPGGRHLKVAAGAQHEIVLRTTGDPPENNCRPAVDVLFRSAAAAFPGLSVAVILTGMGRDGTSGLRELRTAGVVSIAQDEATCTVFGMPKEAIQAGLVDAVVPLPSVANEIVKAVS